MNLIIKFLLQLSTKGRYQNYNRFVINEIVVLNSLNQSTWVFQWLEFIDVYAPTAVSRCIGVGRDRVELGPKF